MSSFQKVVSYLFLAYFVILASERIQSLYRAFMDPKVKLFASAFDIYVNLLAMVSVISFLVLIIFFDGGFWKSLINDNAKVDYAWLSVVSGILLFSGMVHTEYTIAPLQFVSYGALIIAMVLKTIENGRTSANTLLLWYSLIYSIVFSMAIPVMYRSEIKNAPLFHIIEAVVSFSLVIAFTVMLRNIFLGKGEDLMSVVPFLIALIGDAVIIAMRWKESVNSFVLIFSSLMTVMFIVGKIIEERVN